MIELLVESLKFWYQLGVTQNNFWVRKKLLNKYNCLLWWFSEMWKERRRTKEPFKNKIKASEACLWIFQNVFSASAWLKLVHGKLNWLLLSCLSFLFQQSNVDIVFARLRRISLWSTLLKIKAPKRGFNNNAIEEPFWVPKCVKNILVTFYAMEKLYGF